MLSGNTPAFLLREELLDSPELSSPVVLLQAPAGYGKSVLASQYAQRFPGVVLEPRASDPDALHNLIMTSSQGGRHLFVLEDLHRLSARQQQFLARLLQDAPKNIRFLLTSHSPLSVAFAPLMASGRMRILPPARFLFTPGEVITLSRTLLRESDPFHLDRRITSLLHETRGWPYAYIEGLQKIASPDAAADPTQLTDAMQEKLKEVFLSLSEPMRRYVSQIAILPDPQTSYLCALLTESADSAAYMLELRSIAPLLSINEEGVSLFPIFTRFLLDQLSMGERRELSARASILMLEEKRTEESIALALDSEQPDLLRKAIRDVDPQAFAATSARELLPHLLSLDPPLTHHERLLTGIGLASSGHFAQAAELFTSLREAAYALPDTTLYQYATLSLSRALVHLGETGEAESHLLTLFVLGLRDGKAARDDAFVDLMELYLRAGKTQRATLLCEYILSPARACAISDSAHLYRVIISLCRGDVKQCERALATLPRSVSTSENGQAVRHLFGMLTGQQAQVSPSGNRPILRILHDILLQQGEGASPMRFSSSPTAMQPSALQADTTLLSDAGEAYQGLYSPVLWRTLLERAESSHRLILAHVLHKASLHALSQNDLPKAVEYATHCREVSTAAEYQYYIHISDILLRIIEQKSSGSENARDLIASLASLANEQGIHFSSSLSNTLKTVYAGYATESIGSAPLEKVQAYKIDVRCFGAFTVSHYGHPDQPIHFRTRKTAELLAFLVHNGGQMIDRDQIMLELWPERSQDTARTLLHTTLYNLRKGLAAFELEDWILYDKHSYGVSLDSVRCDALLLSAFLAQAPALPDDVLREDVHMLDLYAGSYLYNIDGSWHLSTQVHFEQSVIDIRQRLASYLQQIGEHREALHHLGIITKLDPFRESSHIAFIECNMQLGNRAAALRQYKHMCRLLNDELGVSPEDATHKKIQALLGTNA